jgi:hypothetical protein
MTLQENESLHQRKLIEAFLEVNKIQGQVYIDNEVKTGTRQKNPRVKNEKFQVEKNPKGVYELKVTWSNQVVDAEFISEMQLLLHLVKLLNK